MMKIITKILSIFLVFVNLNAQFLLDWQQTFDGGRNDFAQSIHFDNEGNIILVGSSFGINLTDDVAVAKYSSEGQFIWAKTFDIGQNDRPIGVYFDAENNIIVGAKGNDSSFYRDDFYLLKYSEDGDILFEKRVAWYANYGTDYLGEADQLHMDNYNNLILSGVTWFVKMDFQGNLIHKVIDSLDLENQGYFEGIHSVFNPSNGEIIINSKLQKANNYSFFTIKKDNAGEITAQNTIMDFGATEVYAYVNDWKLNTEGKYYLALHVQNSIVYPNEVNQFPHLTCLNADGTIFWDKIISASPGFDLVNGMKSISLDQGGNIWTTGLVDSKFFIAKFSGAGEMTWIRIDTTLSSGSKIICDQRDGIVAAYDKNGYDIWIIKYDQFGNQLTKYFIPGKNVFTPAYINDLEVKPDRKLLALGTIYNTTWNWNLYQFDDPTVDVKDNIPPSEFTLSQNYPNPFNPSTSIEYSVPTNENVTLKVFDILGREVATLVNQEMNPGNYKVHFDASNLSSGIYFYKISSGTYNKTMKMLLLK